MLVEYPVQFLYAVTEVQLHTGNWKDSSCMGAAVISGSVLVCLTVL